MRGVERIGAVLVAVLATAAIALASAVPWTAERGDDGVVRLSWRAVGRRLEACREPTADELAALPIHMRQQTICEARLAPFALRVAIDGERVHDAFVRPSGARADRPAYVHEEFVVAPGVHRLQVAFAEQAPAEVAPLPPQRLDVEVRVEAGRIVLVTRDDDGLRLVRP